MEVYIKHRKITVIGNKYKTISCEILIFRNVFMLVLAQFISIRI